MATYTVQAPTGEVITLEGPEGATQDEIVKQAQSLYKPKAREVSATSMAKDFGKATASLADTALNALTGTLDWAAYGLARPYYGFTTDMTPEQATAKARAETTSPKDVIGRALGITQDPAYQQELSRRAMGAVGEGMGKVTKPVAEATGIPEPDVEHMLNSLLMPVAPYVGKAGTAIGKGIYAAEPAMAAIAKAPITVPVAAAKAPFQFGKGVMEGFRNPEPGPNSAFVPLKPTYFPQGPVNRFMAGEIDRPALESTARPTAELTQGPVSQLGVMTAPRNAAGEPLVALKGRGIEAYGENLGRSYHKSPLQLAADVGLTALGAGPLMSGLKAAQTGTGALLQRRAGFAPGFLEKYNAAEMPPPGGPVPPGAGPTPPPVAPIAPQPIPPGPPTPPGQVPKAVSPDELKATAAEVVQEATQPEAPVAPTTELPVVQKAKQVMGEQYRPPVEEAPVAPAAVEPPPVVETPPAPTVNNIMTNTLPTTEHGKVPVTGREYYEHYTKGGLSPNELKYAPGTLAETLYNKAKQDPTSLTRKDIEDWYKYDHSESLIPDFTPTKATKKRAAITEAEKVEAASKKLSDKIIRDYERIQQKPTRGRPELLGLTPEEAMAYDRARMDAHAKKIAEENAREAAERAVKEQIPVKKAAKKKVKSKL